MDNSTALITSRTQVIGEVESTSGHGKHLSCANVSRERCQVAPHKEWVCGFSNLLGVLTSLGYRVRMGRGKPTHYLSPKGFSKGTFSSNQNPTVDLNRIGLKENHKASVSSKQTCLRWSALQNVRLAKLICSALKIKELVCKSSCDSYFLLSTIILHVKWWADMFYDVWVQLIFIVNQFKDIQTTKRQKFSSASAVSERPGSSRC